MTNEDIFMTGLLGGAVFAAYWTLPKIATDISSFILERRFERDLRSAILHCQPAWSEVRDLAQEAGLTDRNAYDIACRIRHKIMTGAEGDKGIGQHRALVDGWIGAYRLKEPFKGLPDSTRVSLERLRDDLGGNTEALQNVTANIREMVKARALRERIAYWISYVGLGGTVFTVWSYMHPYTQAT